MSTKKCLAFIMSAILCKNLALGQKLKVGDKVPDFETMDTNGDMVNLDNYKGEKVLLAFFRYAGCPVCNFRVHELIQNYDTIRSKGYRIIAVFESPNSTLQEYLSDTPVPFVMIGDPELTLYKKFRVEKSFWRTMGSAFQKQTNDAVKQGKKLFRKKYKRDGTLTRLPAEFIIDENGVLKTVYYGTSIGDHLPLQEILNYKG